MNLYIVIYLAGVVGGTIGPVPYDLDECQRRIAEKTAELNRSVVTPDGYSADDLRLACEWHDTRPENDPRAGEPR